MTQEEVCSSVSNHAESRKSCQKRTRPPPNVEHQTVSPAALELLAEMEPWLWILLAALCFECRGEDKVMQPPEDVVAAEGDTVTLDCTFQTSDTYSTLFWYKQENNNFPKLLLRAKQKPSDPQRISALIIKTSAPLKIQELQLSDSAVYYCALRPTVTGSSRNGKTPKTWRVQLLQEAAASVLTCSNSKITAKFSSNESRDRVDLQVSSAAVPDSAVYDCAVRPRVTGNPQLSTTTQHPAPGSLRHTRGPMTQEESVRRRQVMQPPEDVVAAEGDTVTLDCTFQTSDTNPYLFWGKQKMSLRRDFPPTLNPTMKSAPLKIQELQLSDSAVYYCALRPTVTEAAEVRTKPPQ
ncbi:T-cell receptor alpha chain V region RL-5 [Takifugu flavidus]|nr:T-cell receptor alpha chain V region RL-5 [Takifugu flavidus]